MEFLVAHKIEIAFTLIGALISVLLAVSSSQIHLALRNKANYKKALNSTINAFLGKWYTYHFTMEHKEVVFREETWEFKLRKNGEVSITTCDIERPNLIYVGRVNSITEASIICTMEGKMHLEEYYMRIRYPIPTSQETTFGLKIGVDFENEIFSTVYIFSHKRLQKETSKQQLRSKLQEQGIDYFMKLPA